MSQTPTLSKPSLYKIDSDSPGAHAVTITGGTCKVCGYKFFPMQSRGCEKCGAQSTDLIEADLGSTGILLSAATVHLHASRTRKAPFVIGVIALDTGPVIRTLLHNMPNAEHEPNKPLRAILVETTDNEAPPTLDLRFAPTITPNT